MDRIEDATQKTAQGRQRWALLLLVSALLFIGGSSSAEPVGELPYEDSGTFAIVFENDSFTASDRNYTNGVRFSYLSKANGGPAAGRWLGEHLLGAEAEDRIYTGIAVGQSMFTPQDIDVPQLLPDQHPYAGWLYLSFSLLVDSGTSLNTLSLDVGLVGPDSGAEWTQRRVHDTFGAQDPKGWDNQLENEVGVALAYDHKWRALAEWEAVGLGIDLTPNAGFTLGNVRTDLNAGLTLRIGNNLRNDYGPPRIRPSVAGGGFFEPVDHFSWYVFAGISGRAVAYDIFLDGNTMRDSTEVDRRPFVGDAQAGLVIQYSRWQLGFTAVTRTEEFETQKDSQIFGAISLSVKL